MPGCSPGSADEARRKQVVVEMVVRIGHSSQYGVSLIEKTNKRAARPPNKALELTAVMATLEA